MRKELEAFIEESFAGLPPSPETEQAKAQVRKQLEADAAVYRAKGMAPWAADQHAMMRFGAGGRRPHGPDPGLVDHLRHCHCYLRHCGRVS